MDESWRISMASVVPRRRSTEQPRRNIYRPDASDPNVDDFSDVFGGPPRSLLHLRRRFSTTDFGDMIRPAAAAAGTFYDEIFMPSDRRAGAFPARSGRNLAGFRIPEAAAAAEIRIRRPQVLMRTNDDGFYDDIFGRNGGGGGGERMRSRSRSKTTTSNSTSTTSVLINNSEEEEEEYLRSPSVPLRRAAPIADDAIFSSFASKLRPITIPVRRRRECSPLSAYSSSGEDSNGNSNMTFSLNDPMSSSSCFVDLSDRASTTADFFQQQQQQQQQQYRASTTPDFFQQQQEQQQCGISTSTLCSPSPPPPLSLSDSISSLHYQISLLQKKHRPGCCSGDISDIGSPSSLVSSSVFDPHHHPPMTTAAATESSFVTEIDNSCCHGMGETEGAAAIDEAIAWAKEKYWNHDASNKSEVLSMIRHHDMIDSPNASICNIRLQQFFFPCAYDRLLFLPILLFLFLFYFLYHNVYKLLRCPGVNNSSLPSI